MAINYGKGKNDLDYDLAFNKERVQVGLNIVFRNFADTFSFKVLQNKFLRDCCKDARRDCKLFRPKYVEQEN